MRARGFTIAEIYHRQRQIIKAEPVKNTDKKVGFKIPVKVFTICGELGLATNRSAVSHIEEAVRSALIIGISPYTVNKLSYLVRANPFYPAMIWVSPRIAKQLQKIKEQSKILPAKFITAAVALHWLALEDLYISRQLH